LEIRELHSGGEHERVVEAVDTAAGYHGIIAIHSTKLGPAVGGTRVWDYKSFDEALTDALRLSRGMTYKAALAGLPLGGGKSVIIADSRKMNRESIFRAHGRFINHFNGQYITGEDVGTTPADMELVRQETPYAAGLAHKSGDPSPFTAHGVFRAMQAAAHHRWQTGSLSGRTVAIQGCGHVGYQLARKLHQAGAALVVTDVDPARAARVAKEFGAKQVEPEEIFNVEAEIFAPCALGGILNDGTIPRLRATIVCGAANNQLAEDRHAEALGARGILYVPDYVANAGGIINGAQEMGRAPADSNAAIEAIYDTVLEIVTMAAAQHITPARAADRVAEARLAK
jgi:leucine dehydrogenase